MLALSTYMGHVKISNTYWYLTGVPELMALAGQRFERFADAGGATMSKLSDPAEPTELRGAGAVVLR